MKVHVRVAFVACGSEPALQNFMIETNLNKWIAIREFILTSSFPKF